MVRVGLLLVLFGFGSVALYFINYHFTLLMWADPMQPAFGLGLGAVGVLLLLTPLLRNKDSQEQAPAGGPPPVGYGPPSGPQPVPMQPPMQHAVPPQGPQQFGPRPPQGPPPQRMPGPPQGPPPQYGPGQGPAPYGPPGGFGPQGGPPYGPRG